MLHYHRYTTIEIQSRRDYLSLLCIETKCNFHVACAYAFALCAFTCTLCTPWATERLVFNCKHIPSDQRMAHCYCYFPTTCFLRSGFSCNFFYYCVVFAHFDVEWSNVLLSVANNKITIKFAVCTRIEMPYSWPYTWVQCKQTTKLFTHFIYLHCIWIWSCINAFGISKEQTSTGIQNRRKYHRYLQFNSFSEL